jgi:hypothetical protein
MRQAHPGGICSRTLQPILIPSASSSDVSCRPHHPLLIHGCTVPAPTPICKLYFGMVFMAPTGLPLFDHAVSIPSSLPREFPQDAAATAAAAAAAASQWTESVSFLADIEVKRLRLRPMCTSLGEEVPFISHAPQPHAALMPPFQLCLGSVDLCDARVRALLKYTPFSCVILMAPTDTSAHPCSAAASFVAGLRESSERAAAACAMN